MRYESKIEETLHKTIKVYFHIRKHLYSTQNALGNVYNIILISNEILGKIKLRVSDSIKVNKINKRGPSSYKWRTS